MAGYSGQMWRTSDGGRSWAKQETNTLSHFNSVSAVSVNEAWAATLGAGFSDVVPNVQPSSFLRTTDGGATWVDALRSSTYGVFQQGEFTNAQHGWLIATACFGGGSTQA